MLQCDNKVTQWAVKKENIVFADDRKVARIFGLQENEVNQKKRKSLKEVRVIKSCGQSDQRLIKKKEKKNLCLVGSHFFKSLRFHDRTLLLQNR